MNSQLVGSYRREIFCIRFYFQGFFLNRRGRIGDQLVFWNFKGEEQSSLVLTGLMAIVQGRLGLIIYVYL